MLSSTVDHKIKLDQGDNFHADDKLIKSKVEMTRSIKASLFCGQGSVSETRISIEERRIRDDLEMDIEEDLECGIIENMGRLACHLQRLYQHRDTRQLTGSATDDHILPPHSENTFFGR